jgi:hypothetical protein
MAINYVWSAEKLDCYPMLDGQPNVVFNINWKVSANNENYTSEFHGVQYVNYAPNISFTPYADLTNNQIIDWVKNAIGVKKIIEIEQNLAGVLANKESPSAVTLPLPWTA